MTTLERIPTANGVREAARRLAGQAVKTPLLENATLNERVDGRVLMKAEIFQHCGSFKFRGAYNLLSQLSEAEKAAGVLAWSSGNHAQGVALAAKRLGVHATIVMPEDAPAIKTDNVRALGAKIIFYDRYKDDREALGRRIASQQGLALAPSYDHPDIIEGQGSVALEAAQQAHEMNAPMDAFIVCCGGGGLTAGCATILADVAPGTDVWIAEPQGFDETWASIRDGERRYADVTAKTICDAAATPTPGTLTLPIMNRLVRGGVTVSEAEVSAAMAFAFRNLKIVLEPGGAMALAAVLSGKFDANNRVTGLTLSGGNVDKSLFFNLLEGHR